MTAVNMMIQAKARAGFIISDTAVTSPEGRLIESCPKVLYGIGRFPWAMGITGDVHPKIMLQAIGAFNPLSYKQLVKTLPLALHDAIQRQAEGQGFEPDYFSVTLTGAAWDFVKKRPVGFIVTSKEGFSHAGIDPFMFYETSSSLTGGEIPYVQSIAGEDGGIVVDHTRFDPERDGLQLIDIQRRAPLVPRNSGCSDYPHRIGCEVLLTKVTKRGVVNWMLHDYGDTLGEFIDPARDMINNTLGVGIDAA